MSDAISMSFPHPNSAISGYRPDIDGLRAVAVIAVLLFHLNIPLMTGGFVGVDIFFVISGYLITSKILGDMAAGHFSIADFYVARIRRIAPAMLAMLAVVFSCASLFYSPSSLRELAISTLAALFSVSNIHFWLTSGYFDTAAESKALLHTWSLGVEEQFYLVWPLLIAISARRKLLLFVVLICITVSTAAAQVALQVGDSAAYFLLPFRFGELATGGLVAILPRLNLSPKLHDGGLIAGFGLIILSIFLFDENVPFPGIAALAPTLGSALIIYHGDRAGHARLLRHPAAVAIGKISYSLYLVHWPIIVLLQYYLFRQFSVLESLVVIPVMLVLAHLSYRYIETPFRSRKSSDFVISRTRLLKTFTVGATTLVMFTATAVGSGWSWRISTSIPGFDPTDAVDVIRAEYYGGRACKAPRCETYAGSAKPIVYLFGDSHARALAEGLKLEIPEINFVIYASSACLLVSEVYGSTRGSNHCKTARKHAFEELRKRPAPVILHQSWSKYAPLTIFNTDRPEEVVDTRETKGFVSFVSAMATSLRRLTAKPVLLLGGVPMSGSFMSPVDCKLRPIAAPSDCGVVSADAPQMLIRRDLNVALRQGLDCSIFYLDPFDHLCPSKLCRNLDDQSMPVYSDGGHLSTWGARLLVRSLRPQILKWTRLSSASSVQTSSSESVN